MLHLLHFVSVLYTLLAVAGGRCHKHFGSGGGGGRGGGEGRGANTAGGETNK